MSNYNWSFDFIKNVNIAFEIGSRDLLDSNTIQNKYNCKVYSFECNPDCIKECNKNNINKNVTLIEKAVSQIDGNINFHSFDLNKYNNMGASSMFEIDFISSRKPSDDDYGRTDVQNVISVPSIRLDTFCKENNIVPDAIFMDVQEAELEVLKSAGEYLKDINYIVLEASTRSTYKGGCNIVELDTFLDKNNFKVINCDKSSIKTTDFFTFGDYLYINKKLI